MITCNYFMLLLVTIKFSVIPLLLVTISVSYGKFSVIPLLLVKISVSYTGVKKTMCGRDLQVSTSNQ